VASIVSGVAEGCVQAGCALIGGETAEMPGFYHPDEYDLAGFAVGLVDAPRILDKENVRAGDVLIGLPSSGLHSNGFSLVRKVLDVENADLESPHEALGEHPLGETLLTPTRIYVKPVLAALKAARIKSVAHITGGGFYENLPRCLPEGMTAVIDKKSLPRPAIFDLIQQKGAIPEKEMFSTFNMGVGMCLTVAAEDADKALAALKNAGEAAFVMGEVKPGDEGVVM
jgi:phosphoribosylformylglycinamidine cyclo-ligase